MSNAALAGGGALGCDGSVVAGVCSGCGCFAS